MLYWIIYVGIVFPHSLLKPGKTSYMFFPDSDVTSFAGPFLLPETPYTVPALLDVCVKFVV